MKIYVTTSVESMQGKSILVFLRPMRPRLNDRIHAWQVISTSAGAIAEFEFQPQISARVRTEGVTPGSEIVSPLTPVQPGHLMLAVSRQGLSPTLEHASRGAAAARLTATQSGIYNQTVPFQQLNCEWWVGDGQVVTTPFVDWGMTCTFEYNPALYFMVDSPPASGPNYSVQAFTDMVSYVPPLQAASLTVQLTRDEGRWQFAFCPNALEVPVSLEPEAGAFGDY